MIWLTFTVIRYTRAIILSRLKVRNAKLLLETFPPISKFDDRAPRIGTKSHRSKLTYESSDKIIYRGRLSRGSIMILGSVISSEGRDRLTCSSLGQIQGGGAKAHGLAATLAVGGVNGDLVAAARV